MSLSLCRFAARQVACTEVQQFRRLLFGAVDAGRRARERDLRERHRRGASRTPIVCQTWRGAGVMGCVCCQACQLRLRV